MNNKWAWLILAAIVVAIGVKISLPRSVTEVSLHSAQLLPATKALPAIKLEKNKTEILELYDSLALYQPNQNEWYACVIHHENMCLVKDESMLEKLKQQNFTASIETPSWW